MSIIERMGDVLGSVLQPQVQRTRQAVPGPGAAGEREPDLIERAVARRNELADTPARKELADTPARKELADTPTRKELADTPAPLDTDFIVKPEVVAQPLRPARGTGPTLHIDLERLQSQNILAPDSRRTPVGESFRRVKRHILANIVNAEVGVPANLVMVTSPMAHEGKTFCAINLAISLAMEMERTVLLVDADVAKPSMPGVLGFSRDTGLMEAMSQGIDLGSVMCKTNIEKLTILPAGKGRHHATELLGSEAMRAMLQEMADRYSDRIIVFDSPPVLAASEASVLAQRMGQIVMVVESGKTTEGALKDALSRIESCRMVGLLLNKVDGPGLGYGSYGYGYGYGYGA